MEILPEQITGEAAVLRMFGFLNAHTAPSLKQEIALLIEGGTRRVVVDLTGIEFMDSSGLAALVAGLKMTRAEGGTLTVTGAKPNVEEVFKLTLLDRVFHFYPNIDSALAAE
jgi:anti-sigma B factor antagonist